MICLTEQTHLDWTGRLAYMTAKFEKRKTELYAMDLIWMIARASWELSTPQPSNVELDHTPADRRTAAQITRDMLKKAQE